MGHASRRETRGPSNGRLAKIGTAGATVETTTRINAKFSVGFSTKNNAVGATMRTTPRKIKATLMVRYARRPTRTPLARLVAVSIGTANPATAATGHENCRL